MKKILLIFFILSLMISCDRNESKEIIKIHNKINELTKKIKAVEEESPLKAKDWYPEIKGKIERIDKIETRLNKIEKNLEEINKRLTKIEKEIPKKEEN
ncbi:MAG: hypothetical protein ABIN61_04310 [candidate division WOR-3 bacterium]